MMIVKLCKIHFEEAAGVDVEDEPEIAAQYKPDEGPCEAYQCNAVGPRWTVLGNIE